MAKTDISVVIPTYRNPAYLDLCLRSAVENQAGDNEIIVIVDGYGDESREVLSRYAGVSVLEFDENKGQQIAHNTGVTLASGKYVLIVNDDNVFPSNWDARLLRAFNHLPLGGSLILTPNQIEPRPSIFRSFAIKDFGTTPETFDYDKFLLDEQDIHSWTDLYSPDGSTWPVFMERATYMALGGIDEHFPSPAVADWDFFYRAHILNIQTSRFMGMHFYHFAGAATKRSPEQAERHMEQEMRSREYFKWKWGFAPHRDRLNRIIEFDTSPSVRPLSLGTQNEIQQLGTTRTD